MILVRAGEQCDAYPSPSIGVFRDRNQVGAGDKRANITTSWNWDRKFLVIIEIENVTQSEGGGFC